MVAFLCLAPLVSCMTPALWDATNPREYVAMAKTPENESRLQQSGLAYRTDEERSLFYVEKTNLQKYKDYAVRTLVTPVTVALDTATTVVVVGAAVFVLMHSDYSYQTKIEDQREYDEWKSLREVLDSMQMDDEVDSDPAWRKQSLGYP